MIRYLKRLFRTLRDWVTSSELSEEVASSEPLSRFIYQSNHFNANTKKINSSAFLPPPNRELSVFRIFRLGDSEIWEIGNTIRAKPTKARADVVAGKIQQAGLTVIPETSAHVRHANIVGWPETKHEQKVFAIKLSQAATLKLPLA